MIDNRARHGTLTTVLLLLGFAGFVQPVAAQDARPELQRATMSRAKGAENAPVFVYEFADFQCPHCARFALEVFPRIDSAFVRTGKVHWVFVHMPLPNHPNAWVAHEAAACAGAVADRFWPMHDRIFATQDEWARATDPGTILAGIAREIGVPSEAFDDCVTADRVAPMLLQDVIFAATSRINGTPAFNVNNEHSVVGLKTFEEWKDLLEKKLKKP
jgi:protein-disulfide isomerase